MELNTITQKQNNFCSIGGRGEGGAVFNNNILTPLTILPWAVQFVKECLIRMSVVNLDIFFSITIKRHLKTEIGKK